MLCVVCRLLTTLSKATLNQCQALFSEHTLCVLFIIFAIYFSIVVVVVVVVMCMLLLL